MNKAKFLLSSFSTNDLKGLDLEIKALKMKSQFTLFEFLDELHEKIRVELLRRNQVGRSTK